MASVTEIEDDNWEEDWTGSDRGDFVYKCFFDEKEFDSPLKALENDALVTNGQFNLLNLIQQVCRKASVCCYEGCFS